MRPNNPKSPAARRAARERFVAENFFRCKGNPRALAGLAVRTGFYSSKVALSQIAWRFTMTIARHLQKS
jgi:hypothetical protein